MIERVDPELTALAAGLKPVVRCTVAPEEADALAARWQARGLAVARARRTATLAGTPKAVLYLARARALAEGAREAEEPILPGEMLASIEHELECQRALGRLLGYPRCCVDAHLARTERTRKGLEDYALVSEVFAVARSAQVARPDARLNHLLTKAGWRLLSWYPCRYDCELSSRYATAVLERMRARSSAYVDALAVALARPVLVDAAGLVAVVRAVGDETPALVERIDGAWPAGPEAVLLHFA